MTVIEMSDATPPEASGGQVAVSLRRAHSRIGLQAESWSGQLHTGVDLGTATCVLTVVDDTGEAVWVDTNATAALRDGVVVDFTAAVAAVRTLKRDAEAALGVELEHAATAYPPCVGEADSRACRFVLESAGFDQIAMLDEVSAANRTLGIRDGAVVDVGGGSTGVGVFSGGELRALDDRAGGGYHLDLIVAGAMGISVPEAERLKHESPETVTTVLRPGIERVAESIRDLTTGWEALDVHLAGGALMLPGMDSTLAARLGRSVHAYPHALLITPLGIARSAP
ncbi:ethanolamine utilization protein EutJ [Prauserella halophila]|uniref:Ethanolamine utilization protein EutJ n=2 Tax=Prauserella halophila TaxID=185641 RepID=A0ABP4GW65_9PSEU|nr:ethanolamine utilization protein EutJ [Prauserella halophila]